MGKHTRLTAGVAATPGLRTRAWAVGAVVIGIVASSMIMWQTSRAAFTATTSNDGNTFSAGSVTITNNTGSAMFSASALRPGSTATVCMGVEYTGSLTPSAIKLYTAGAQESNNGGAYGAWANDNTSEMDSNLSMEILVGSTDLAADPGSSCAAETGSFTDVAGAAPGTSMQTMIATNTSFSNGLASQWGTITANKWRVWKFIYTMSASATNGAQNDGLKVNFVWEADS